MDKLAYESLVTPQEAVKLIDYRTLQDIHIANDVAKSYMSTKSPDAYERFVLSNALNGCTWILGIVWNAGRIQGIREERAKRRAARNKKTSGAPRAAFRGD